MSVQAQADFILELNERQRNPPNNNRAEIQGYFTGLRDWPEPEPAGQNASDPETKDTEHGGTPMTCTTTRYDITTNPDTIVMLSPDIASLWPGALIQGEGFSKGIGSVRELPIKERAPTDVLVNLTAQVGYVHVDRPDALTVRDAISTLIRGIKDDLGTSVTFRMTETYSSEQAMLTVGLSAKFAGAEMKAKHSSQTSNDRRVLTASFIQNCFTVFIPNPATPADFFGPEYHIQQLLEQEQLGRIGQDNLPVFLSSVTYGRMLYVTITSSKNMEDLKNALNASYNNVSGELEQQHRQVLEESEIAVTATGITDEAARDLIRTGKIAEFFSHRMNLNSAWPMSYVFYNMKDLSIAGIADTAHYAITICQPRVVSKPSEALSRHMDAGGTGIREYARFISAAASNSSDHGTRSIRMGQARSNHNVFLDEIRWMNTTPHGNDDVHWLSKVWIPQILDEVERQAKIWKRGYDTNPSDHGTQAVYAEALQYNASQRVLMTALAEKTKSP